MLLEAPILLVSTHRFPKVINVFTHEFVQRLLEHFSDVMPLGVRCAEALRPPNENAVVDAILPNTDIQNG